MAAWVIANLATIVIGLILLAVVYAIVWHLAKSKKSGKSSCGCGCGSCAMNGACHHEKKL